MEGYRSPWEFDQRTTGGGPDSPWFQDFAATVRFWDAAGPETVKDAKVFREIDGINMMQIAGKHESQDPFPEAENTGTYFAQPKTGSFGRRKK